jgi:uncharacterized protein YuzE
MRVTFDPEIDMAYIDLTGPNEAWRADHTEPLIVDLGPGSRRLITLDFDSHGRLLGIEIAGAAAALPRSLLAAAAKPRRSSGNG